MDSISKVLVVENSKIAIIAFLTKLKVIKMRKQRRLYVATI